MKRKLSIWPIQASTCISSWVDKWSHTQNVMNVTGDLNFKNSLRKQNKDIKWKSCWNDKIVRHGKINDFLFFKQENKNIKTINLQSNVPSLNTLSGRKWWISLKRKIKDISKWAKIINKFNKVLKINDYITLSKRCNHSSIHHSTTATTQIKFDTFLPCSTRKKVYNYNCTPTLSISTDSHTTNGLAVSM